MTRSQFIKKQHVMVVSDHGLKDGVHTETAYLDVNFSLETNLYLMYQRKSGEF